MIINFQVVFIVVIKTFLLKRSRCRSNTPCDLFSLSMAVADVLKYDCHDNDYHDSKQKMVGSLKVTARGQKEDCEGTPNKNKKKMSLRQGFLTFLFE